MDTRMGGIMKNNATRVIENLINGNCADAKRGARHIGGETLRRAALEAGRPLIVLLANGFAPHYKPPGRYFDACAAGRLLMLAPFAYLRRRQTITREQCRELNAWAQAIVET